MVLMRGKLDGVVAEAGVCGINGASILPLRYL